MPKVEEVQPAPKIEVAAVKPMQIAPATAVIPRQLVKTEVFSLPEVRQRPPSRRLRRMCRPGVLAIPMECLRKTTTTGSPPPSQPRVPSICLPDQGNGNGTGGANGKPRRGRQRRIWKRGSNRRQHGRSNNSRGNGNVRQAGFGDTEPTATMAKAKIPEPSAAPRNTPAEVLSKPNPLYTEEARKMRIEGEVLLEVVFESGRKVRVNRVIRGLGHGLDEAAIHAAEEIHFKPALRDGQPSISTAVLHIVFQLA